MTSADRSAAATTAFGPLVIAAVEQYTPPPARLLDDELAAALLTAGQRLVVRACRWRAVRDRLVTATERFATGLWGAMICRKRYADDAVTEAVATGIGQVVVLGAGLDTRGIRLAAPAGARVFELDQPANVDHKDRRLQAVLGRVPDRVRLIPIDFETDNLAAVLTSNGFEPAAPALFVWEAVTQYLSEDAVRATLAFLAKAAGGSRLIFTYVRADFLDGTNSYGAERLRRRMTGRDEVWRFGIYPSAVGALLGEYGWAEREQVGSAEYTVRYLEPISRKMPISEIERFVAAELIS
jgi:methyltransferase (TIGR00027 family)